MKRLYTRNSVRSKNVLDTPITNSNISAPNCILGGRISGTRLSSNSAVHSNRMNCAAMNPRHPRSLPLAATSLARNVQMVTLEMSIATAAGTRKAPPGSPTLLLSVLWHRRAIERLVQQLPLEGPPPEPRSSDKAAGAATLSGDA